MGGAIECLVESAAVADFFELKSTQQLCGQPFLHSDDSTLVVNVKDDARVGQKTASACGHRCPASDSSGNGLLQWFELLLGTRSSLLWPTL